MDGGLRRYHQRMHDIEKLMARDEMAMSSIRAAEQEDERQQVQKLKEEGNVAFRSGNLASARQHYTDAIELDFKCGNDEKLTAALYANRAAAALGASDHAQAEGDCRRSLQREDSSKVQVRCAEASVGLGKPAAALECLARALVLEPTNSKARELIAALRRDHSPDVLGEVSLETMTRLRKRAAAQAERGAQQQAAVRGVVLQQLRAAVLVEKRVVEASVEGVGLLHGEHAHGELELEVRKACNLHLLHLPPVGEQHVLQRLRA